MRTFLKQRFAVALLAIGTTMALMTACGTANTDSLSKAERKRIQEMKVREMLDNRHFKIEVDMMHPHTYPARQLSSYYSVEVIWEEPTRCPTEEARRSTSRRL